MKKILLALVACVGLTFSATGCAEGVYYGDPSVSPTIGVVEFCDDYGCRTVNAPYYYVGGDVVYWDAHFGVWVGPHSYWREGRWYGGSVYGYHGYYHRGAYHGFYGGGGAWRPNGGVYHGGFHGGGGHGHR
jgi:hypothetical protein